MKINVEIDATPEELRKFFGLPDVSALQDELMAKFREKMESGMTEYDPIKLMEPYLPDNLKSMEGFQKAFWNMVKTPKSGNPDD